MNNEQRILVATLTVLVLAILAFAVMGITLSDEQRTWLFSESRPFEIASEWLWLMLGAVCLLNSGWEWHRRGLFAAAAAMAAMREADLHKAFTTGSIFKSNY